MPSHAELGRIFEMNIGEQCEGVSSIIDQFMEMSLDFRSGSQEEQELLYFLSKNKELHENLEQIKREILAVYDHFAQDVIYVGTIPKQSGWKLYSKFQSQGNRLLDATSPSGYCLAATRGTDERSRYRIYMEGIPADGSLF